MSDAKERDALKGSLTMIRECQRLIQSGHYAGSRAHKIAACLAYLEALEKSVREQLGHPSEAKDTDK